MNTHDLYRHFDKDGVLLYVGISLSAIGRLRDHGHTAQWFDQIAMVTISKFASRREVMDAEKEAIRSESPLWNVAHVKTGAARMRRELRAYDAGVKGLSKRGLIDYYGGTEASLARELGMSPQRVNLWGDVLNRQQVDGVLAALLRKEAAYLDSVCPEGIPEYVWQCIAVGK
jgi:hypothetical protein